MNLDDPKLTAYALGEPLPPADRAEVETYLQTSPEARAFVEETAAFAQTLQAAFAGEAPPSPAGAARRVQLTAHAEATARRRLRRRVIRWAGALGVVMLFVGYVIVPAFTGRVYRLSRSDLERLHRKEPAMGAPIGLEAKEGQNSDHLQPAPMATPPSLERVEGQLAKTKPFAFSATGAGEAAPGLHPREDARLRSLTAQLEQKLPLAPTAPTFANTQLDRDAAFNTEAYAATQENGFRSVADHPLSTFSIDVDTASYANVRRFLTQGQLPPAGAVRVEELLNYFTYAYPQPKGSAPFSTTLEVAACPWKPEHRLVRIGLKGRETPKAERPPAHLVFLIDVSGSMRGENKLPLLKQSLRLLVEELRGDDTVAIAVYAGAAGLALPPTPVEEKAQIFAKLEALEAGGSTNGGQGIQLAYKIAAEGRAKGGISRVILASDGDFNVGATSQADLVKMIEAEAKSGTFLTVLGFGMGNYKDTTMENLANRGNGHYAYIDTLREARKVLVEQVGGTLETIAKDVKIQVEFNPATVSAYRLIGYENRLLAKEDFNDDTKDAGEIGAGHTVTALYEVIPAGLPSPTPGVDVLKYQQKPAPAPASNELLTLKLRYKEPQGSESRLLQEPLTDSGHTWAQSSADFRFAAAVAGFGMLLQCSPHAGGATWASIAELAEEGKGPDTGGLRAEFLELVERASKLTPPKEAQ